MHEHTNSQINNHKKHKNVVQDSMKVIGVVWVNTAFVSETFVKFKKADTDRASKDKGTPLGFAVSVSRFSSCGCCA